MAKLPTGQQEQQPVIKVALWGYGNQNQLMAKYLYSDKRYNVVSIISHHDVGKDYGTVESSNWGSITSGQKKTGVSIVAEQDAASELERTQPDICILATRSRLADIAPSLRTCAQAKCNVVTIAEEMIYSWPSAPALTKEMDLLFQQNGVTLTGSGFEDIAWCQMMMSVSAMMVDVKKIRGKTLYNLDDYGAVLAEEHGVGMTPQQFQATIAKAGNKDKPKSFIYNFNIWFAAAMGLTTLDTVEVYKPIVWAAVRPLYSKALGRDIMPGQVAGMSVVSTTTTKEGVTIALENVGKCFEEGKDEDFIDCQFEGGEPGPVAGYEMRNSPSPQMTNTAALSRIPAIINAPPGYVTTDQFIKNMQENCLATYKHRA